MCSIGTTNATYLIRSYRSARFVRIYTMMGVNRDLEILFFESHSKRKFPKHLFFMAMFEKRWPVPRERLARSSRDFSVSSLFLPRRDSAAKRVSVKTVSRGADPSVLSWETCAGAELGRRISCMLERGNEKKIRRLCREFPEVPPDPEINHWLINTPVVRQ